MTREHNGPRFKVTDSVILIMAVLVAVVILASFSSTAVRVLIGVILGIVAVAVGMRARSR
jgi:hypothetical protein